MSLVTALLVRNEADRYLKRVLERCAAFSDEVLVLDDGSTDATVQVAKDMGCIVKQRVEKAAWWGGGMGGECRALESGARRELWERGSKLAKEGWLLICDADMLLEGDIRPLCQTWELNTWAFPLYDLWDGEQTARVDGAWSYGPITPRPWLFCPSRVPQGWHAEWPTRGIHCGHSPANWPMMCGIAPSDTYWLHLAYLDKQHRAEKHAKYMAIAKQLTPFEQAHAASIIDA
jgi:glycosyl transferase family 2